MPPICDHSVIYIIDEIIDMWYNHKKQGASTVWISKPIGNEGVCPAITQDIPDGRRVTVHCI